MTISVIVADLGLSADQNAKRLVAFFPGYDYAIIDLKLPKKQVWAANPSFANFDRRNKKYDFPIQLFTIV
jgi:hypothetical protein